jgi:hypothetical protein
MTVAGANNAGEAIHYYQRVIDCFAGLPTFSHDKNAVTLLHGIIA